MINQLKLGASALAALVPLAIGLSLPAPAAPTASELADVAVGYYKAHDKVRAQQTLDTALATDPKDFHARFIAGLFAAQNKDPNGAFEHLSQAHALRPDDVDATLALGVVAHRLGKREQADGLYSEVLSKDPSNAKATFNKAEVALANHDLRAAKSWFEKYLVLAPQANDASKVRDTVRLIDVELNKVRKSS